MIVIGDKTALMDTIEWTNKSYKTWSTGELKVFIGSTIKRDLTNMTLNISQPDLIDKMTQGFK